MYNVLLADDEMLDLEGMKAFIPWDALGMRVAGAVTNGFEAVKVLEKQAIDILVSDVRMPGMTGLELAKRARELIPGLKIIFVSGHRDFYYAKEAMALHASDYVLKPMEDEELAAALEKIRQRLDVEREREVTLRQIAPVVKKEYMVRLFEGTYDASQLAVLRSEYGFDAADWPMRAAVLEIDHMPGLPDREDDQANNRVRSELFDKLEARAAELGYRHLCRISHRRIALLIPEEGAERAAEQLLDYARAECPYSMTAGIGLACDRPEDVQRSYTQALKALEMKMLRGRGVVIAYDSEQAEEAAAPQDVEAQLAALFQAMSNYELVEVHDHLDELFKNVSHVSSEHTIRNYAMYILMKLDVYLHAMNEDLFRLLGIDIGNLDILMQLETIGDIRSWLRRKVYEISELLQEKKKKRNWKLAQDIMVYVKARLHDNITLRDVAEQFSFSPNYLGHLFKEETGKTFSEFLISLRMETACELLRTTSLKIYEIADRVGYRYLPYFSRQFKETYGMTPLEYRRKA